MKTDFIIAVLLIAVGTYLIRAVPFVLSSKKETGKKKLASNQSLFSTDGSLDDCRIVGSFCCISTKNTRYFAVD